MKQISKLQTLGFCLGKAVWASLQDIGNTVMDNSSVWQINSKSRNPQTREI